MTYQHTTLAEGRWHTMSLAEQLGNIGSEIHRARLAQENHEGRFIGACDRALELFDLTLSDARWRGRFLEIGRARDLFCDAMLGGKEYGTTLASLEPYFDRFALFARAS